MTLRDIGKLTSDLGRRLTAFFDAPLAPDAAPLEIVRAVLDDVERHVEGVGRGRRVFPYREVEIQVVGPDCKAPRLHAAFRGIDARIRERLQEVRCEVPEPLAIGLEVFCERPENWSEGQILAVIYRGDTTPESAPAMAEPARPVLKLVVVKGQATAPEYRFTDASIAIGRSADLVDDHGRVRRNRVAFTDAVDGVTETVGRAHARLVADPRGGYRVIDDGSRNGTSIVRDGEVIPVHRQDPRGVRIRPGDEIQVGRAVLRVEFE